MVLEIYIRMNVVVLLIYVYDLSSSVNHSKAGFKGKIDETWLVEAPPRYRIGFALVMVGLSYLGQGSRGSLGQKSQVPRLPPQSRLRKSLWPLAEEVPLGLWVGSFSPKGSRSSLLFVC